MALSENAKANGDNMAIIMAMAASKACRNIYVMWRANS